MMRDFAKISPSLWTSRKFLSLPDDASKLVYFYLLTSPHSNQIGCYVLPDAYACEDMHWKIADYRAALENLSTATLIEHDQSESLIHIVNWETFNAPTNPKHAVGIFTALSQVPNSQLKINAFQAFARIVRKKAFDADRGVERAISLFLAHHPEARIEKPPVEKPVQNHPGGNGIARLSKGSRKGIATETETETETERETETETKKTRAREADAAATPEGASSSAAEGKRSEGKLDHLLNTELMKRSPR